MTDDQLVTALETASLPPGELDHALHVRLAWAYLRRLPPARAIEAFSAALKRYVAAQGAPDRYHETITWGYMLLVNDRLVRWDGVPSWEAFSAANGDLLAPGLAALRALYRPETLRSDLARRAFLLPDAV